MTRLVKWNKCANSFQGDCDKRLYKVDASIESD